MINTINAVQLADTVVPDYNNQLLKSYSNTDTFVIRTTLSLHINVKYVPNHTKSSSQTDSIYFAYFLLNSISCGAPILCIPGTESENQERASTDLLSSLFWFLTLKKLLVMLPLCHSLFLMKLFYQSMHSQATAEQEQWCQFKYKLQILNFFPWGIIQALWVQCYWRRELPSKSLDQVSTCL